MNYKGLKKDMDEVVKLFSLIKWACASWHSSRAITFVQHGMVLLILSGYDDIRPWYIFHATGSPYHLSLPWYKTAGLKVPSSKNHLYFLNFVHIHVALHPTIPNHPKLCL
jgi:hypothetical protein